MTISRAGIGAVSNTTGSDNLASGTAALRSNKTGSSNVADGVNALNHSTASSNTAVGHQRAAGTHHGRVERRGGQRRGHRT